MDNIKCTECGSEKITKNSKESHAQDCVRGKDLKILRKLPEYLCEDCEAEFDV